MEVWVDGQNNFRVEGAPVDLLAVFGAASAFLRERGRMPVQCLLNGKDLYPDGLRAALEGVSPDAPGKMELRSQEIYLLVEESLAKVNEALAELPGACRELAEIFQSDAPADGFEPFQHVADIWGFVKTEEQRIANALEVDLAEVEIGGQSVASMSAELNTFLTEAAEALTRGDAIALGDLLEYELAPRAEQETAIVAWLQERAAALPR